MTKNNDERSDNHEDKQKRLTMKKNKRRNVSRLGGSGLSLNAFANAKSNSSGYNPSLISMQFSLFFSIFHNFWCIVEYRELKNILHFYV